MVVSNEHALLLAAGWRSIGGEFALHLPRDNRTYSLHAYLSQGTFAQGVELAASHFEQLLTNGSPPRSSSGLQQFDYLAIDELSNTANSSWFDGGEMAARFEAWLKRLAVDGYDKRVILYVNSYNMPQTFGSYGQILRACVSHCRAIGSEIYLSTSDVQRLPAVASTTSLASRALQRAWRRWPPASMRLR
jgi:hypothetical protein